MDSLLKLSKAMSDQNRIDIVTLLQREKRLCVCEIADTLQLSQPLVSRHLKQLKEAGVVSGSSSGKWMIYTIVSKPHALLHAYLKLLKEREEALPTLICCTRR